MDFFFCMRTVRAAPSRLVRGALDDTHFGYLLSADVRHTYIPAGD